MGSDVFELRGNTALYEVLGIFPTATDTQIRQSYLKLAIVYHPDKNPDGGEIFKEISFAHSILSDAAQRRLYDQERLRTHLQDRAREYDPMMDPNVELSAEDLRKFVERKRVEEEAKRQELSEFERRREEEMRRRAEYDARNPNFRAEYEQQRAAMREMAEGRVLSSSQVAQPTTAELMQRLEARQAAAAGSGEVQGSGMSVRRNMMAEFRERHGGEVVAPHTVAAPAPTSSRLAFVADMNRQTAYSGEVVQRIRRSANFDYRSFVEQGVVDGGTIVDDAILADALGLYDRRR